ncbi:MAG TPA: hypothetical protein VHX49_11380 [Candidatus Acidoferrales bacterium]|nr:hypothetical protein [Candidatus Acidoferrales bacterium]
MSGRDALSLNAVDDHRRDERQIGREGLCADCVFARRIESARGSRFVLCEKSRTDPAFAKYPRLPVIACCGFTAKSGGTGPGASPS